MKNKTNLFVFFLSILCLYAIVSAEIGYGISDVGPISSVTSIDDETIIPAQYRLNQNYPNPFNPITTIRFSLAKASFVKLEVYNLQGQKVATLVNSFKAAGNYKTKLDATHMASGIYLYKIQAGDFIQVKKMIMVK